MPNLTLKRGCCLCFDGTNWKISSDNKWKYHPVLVPNDANKYVGQRSILNIECSVFMCCNDEYVAQPTSICELEINDLLHVMCLPEHIGGEPPPEQESKRSKNKSVPAHQSGVLAFNGTNWRLVSDEKWRTVNGFIPDDSDKPIGSKIIGNCEYNVFKNQLGFMAVKKKSI